MPLNCMLKNSDTITHISSHKTKTTKKPECVLSGLYQKKLLGSKTVSSEAQNCQQINSPSPSYSAQSGRVLSPGGEGLSLPWPVQLAWEAKALSSDL